jgi:hypothetical protein
MSEESRTEGEALFEQYLRSQNLTEFEHEKKRPDKRRPPDYTVRINGDIYFFEVKDFDPIGPLGRMIGARNVMRPIREKINQAREKFQEFKEQPCCLVVYNHGNPFISLQDPEEMFGAMYGDPGITMDGNRETGEGNPSTARFAFLGGGKMFRRHWKTPQNTTISAIITLHHVAVGAMRLEKHLNNLSGSRPLTMDDVHSAKVDFDKAERQLGVIVWENYLARIQFPREFFRGPYDERYGRNGQFPERVFVGNFLAELETQGSSSLSFTTKKEVKQGL